MSKLLYVASGDDEIVEHADWVEISALFRADGNVSQEDLARAIIADRGVPQHKSRLLAHDAFAELCNRAESCGENCHPALSCYPFELKDKDTLLQKKPDDPAAPDAGLLYLFLLALTRSDMGSKARAQNAIDPTKVFERLCADVLKEFWGGESNHSNSIVFGTAQTVSQRKFPNQIKILCGQLQEGAGWKTGARSPKAGDGKLDLVVFRRFRDKRPGGLVGFAQCKTGIHWREHLTKLNPRGFCGTYMAAPLLLDPIRIYMVPHRINEDRWNEDTQLGGLLFDRCRIVHYGNSIKVDVLGDCRTWLNSVLAAQKAVP